MIKPSSKNQHTVGTLGVVAAIIEQKGNQHGKSPLGNEVSLTDVRPSSPTNMNNDDKLNASPYFPDICPSAHTVPEILIQPSTPPKRTGGCYHNDSLAAGNEEARQPRQHQNTQSVENPISTRARQRKGPLSNGRRGGADFSDYAQQALIKAGLLTQPESKPVPKK